MPTCAFLSFRFGPTDGVSVVARRWMEVFAGLGFAVTTVAGSADGDLAGLSGEMQIARAEDGSHTYTLGYRLAD